MCVRRAFADVILSDAELGNRAPDLAEWPGGIDLPGDGADCGWDGLAAVAIGVSGRRVCRGRSNNGTASGDSGLKTRWVIATGRSDVGGVGGSEIL